MLRVELRVSWCSIERGCSTKKTGRVKGAKKDVTYKVISFTHWDISITSNFTDTCYQAEIFPLILLSFTHIVLAAPSARLLHIGPPDGLPWRASSQVDQKFFKYLFNALAKHDRYLTNRNRSNNLTLCHWLCTGQ